MKKLLSLLTVICLILSLAACNTSGENVGTAAVNTTTTAENTVDTKDSSDDTTAPSSDSSDDTTEGTSAEELETDLTYKLALIYTNESAEGGMKEYWYSLQFNAPGPRASFKAITALTDNGSVEIKNGISNEGKFELTTYRGFVCEHDENANFALVALGDPAERAGITARLRVKDDVDFDPADLTLVFGINYHTEETVLELGEQRFSVNAEEKDIQTGSRFVHGMSLFKLGGHYYVFHSNEVLSESYSEKDEYYNFTGIYVTCIDGTGNDLKDSLKNWSMVHSKVRDDNFLQEVTFGKYENAMMLENEGDGKISIAYGIMTTDDDFDDEASDGLLDTFLKVNCDGKEVIFLQF